MFGEEPYFQCNFVKLACEPPRQGERELKRKGVIGLESMTYAYFLGRLKSVTLVFEALSYLRNLSNGAFPFSFYISEAEHKPNSEIKKSRSNYIMQEGS